MKFPALICYVVVTLSVFYVAPCQTYSQEPDSPSFGLFAGVGAQTNGTSKSAFQLGGSYDQYVPNHWFGYMFEGGYAAPFTDLHNGSALVSINYMAAWSATHSRNYYPFATVGYSHLFGTGNAVNFGPGLDIRLTPTLAIRVEARDYLTISPRQHTFAIRIGFRRLVYD